MSPGMGTRVEDNHDQRQSQRNVHAILHRRRFRYCYSTAQSSRRRGLEWSHSSVHRKRETVDVIERRACPKAELYKRKIGKIYPFRISR